MKILVIFYSLDGNTRFIAKNIAEKTGADLQELCLKKKVYPKGFFKYLYGGKDVIFKATPELLPLDKDPSSYDILFIGTPVWAGTYSAPLNSLFSLTSIKDKKIALFCCHMGMKANVFKKMQAALEGNRFLGQIDFFSPLSSSKKDTIALKVKRWAEAMVDRAS